MMLVLPTFVLEHEFIFCLVGYMFDGRSATMMDVLTKHNPNDVHGKTATLTPQQLADLEAFILSH